MMSNLQSHQTSPTEADIAAAKNAWNAVADEFNQWDNLSVDEQEKWQGRFADHADAQFPALARLRSALKDDPDDIAAGVPEGAIEAGIDAWEDANREDRKSTRLNPVTNAQLVCRLLLENKNMCSTILYEKQ